MDNNETEFSIMSPELNFHWRILHCAGGDEFEIGNWLEKHREKCYVPSFEMRCRPRIRGGSVRRTRVVPLFPGYLFAQIDSEARTMALIGQRYIARVIPSRPVESSVIDFVAATAKWETERNMAGIKIRPVKRGDRMKILDGIREGESVEVLKAKMNRIIAPMIWFNREVATEIKIERVAS